MAKKKKPADEGGGANWMDTYGDMVTLLLCFFVLLYSFSTTDIVKFQGLASSLQRAFNTNSGAEAIVIPGISMVDIAESPIQPIAPTNPNSEENQVGGPMPDEGEPGSQELFRLAEMLRAYMFDNGLAGEILADELSMSLTIRFPDSIFFDSGRADIRTDAYETLDTVARLFEDHEDFILEVSVEGHTDNRPLVGSRYVDNLELSSVRAANAVRYITATGLIEPSRIVATGCGEDRPIAANDSTENMQKNRRVDFVIASINMEALRGLRD